MRKPRTLELKDGEALPELEDGARAVGAVEYDRWPLNGSQAGSRGSRCAASWAKVGLTSLCAAALLVWLRALASDARTPFAAAMSTTTTTTTTTMTPTTSRGTTTTTTGTEKHYIPTHLEQVVKVEKVEKVARERPSLYCWSLIRPGFEAEIARKQVAQGIGILQCDNASFVSATALDLGVGPIGNVSTVLTANIAVGRSKDGTAGNAELFMAAWETLRKLGEYRHFEWTVKSDPDAVVLPDRLRAHLKPLGAASLYLKNCGEYSGPGWPALFGAVEAVSRPALDTYYAHAGRCKKELKWRAWGEDLFLQLCMNHLGVNSTFDATLVQDGVCKGVSCRAKGVAAFHPFKSVDKWVACYLEATGDLHVDAHARLEAKDA